MLVKSEMRLKRLSAGRCLSSVGGGQLLGAAFAVDGCRYDSSGITGSFAAREEALKRDVLQGVSVSQDTHGRGGARFDPDQDGFVGEKTVRHAVGMAESLA